MSELLITGGRVLPFTDPGTEGLTPRPSAPGTEGLTPRPSAPGAGSRAMGAGGQTLRPQAVLVRDGRIAAVGADAEVRELASSRARAVDATGGTVLPGIVDSHIHLAWWGLASPPFSLDLRAPAVASLADVRARVAEAAASREPGEWIRGRGWREDELAELRDDGRRPTAADLDAAAPEHPVALEHWSYHAVWANSGALRAAGIGRDTPDPPGGHIERDEGGAPSGVLVEAAADLVRRVVPEPSPAERRAAIAAAGRRLVERGVTAVTDPCVTPEGLRDYLALHNAGRLPLRVTALLHWDWPSVTSSADGLRDALAAAPVATGLGDAWLKIGGAKLFADGVPALGTAWMSEPYGGGATGALVCAGATDADRLAELHAMVALLHAHRLQVQVHATGDRACSAVAGAFAAALDADPWDARHVVIHANLLDAGDARALAARGCGANLNALIKWQAADLVRPLLDEERWGRNMPARTLLEAGLRIADSSDAPIVDPDWRQGVETLVRRRARGSGAVSGPEERIGRLDALRAWTAGAAWQQHADGERGSLAPGMLADLVVLRQDVLDVPEEELHAVEPVLTVLDGEVAFERVPA